MNIFYKILFILLIAFFPGIAGAIDDACLSSEDRPITSVVTDCGKIYVRANAPAGGDGRSWATAHNDLSMALSAAEAGCSDTIWIAGGIYKPSVIPEGCSDCTSLRDVTFILKEGIKLFGGFQGNESLLHQRVINDPTILSGDIGISGDSTDNAFHVLVSINSDETTLIDGITITQGNAYIYSDLPKFVEYQDNYFYRNTGGGLYLVNSEVKVRNVTFQNNRGFFGGAVGVDFGSVIAENKISSILTNRNQKSYDPDANKTTSKKTKDKRTKKLLISKSGALKAATNQVGLEITDCQFSNNQAHYGGGIEIEYGSNIRIAECTFSNNEAQYEGGAIYKEFTTATVIDDCAFNANSCIEGGYGGALSMDEVISATVINSQFDTNIVLNDGYGGALSDYYSKGNVIKSCAFTRNLGDDGGFGGAVYLGRSESTMVSRDTFYRNSVTNEGFGGAFYEDDAMRTLIDSCHFEENMAYDNDGEGGALYIDSDSSIVSNSSFNRNMALNGGALYSYEKGLLVSNCSFRYNKAFNEGGAISGYYESRIISTELIANEAYYGGALYTYDNAQMINCLIAHNKAEAGGGIYADSDYTIVVTNCTIANNESMDDEGGGVYNDGSSMDIYNSILWNNKGTSSVKKENQLYADGPTKVGFSITDGGMLNNVVDQGNNIYSDPKFINESIDGDYRLNCSSEAIDLGNDVLNTLETDIAGNERLRGTIDLGAYENIGPDLAEISSIEGSVTVCNGEELLYQINPQECARGYEWSYSGTAKEISGINTTTFSIDSIMSEGILQIKAFNSDDTVLRTVSINLADDITCTLSRCGLDHMIIDGEFMSSEIIPNQTQAKISITSNGTVQNGKSYHFKAGSYIVLDRFFTVEQGGIFEASISPCPSAISNFNSLKNSESSEEYMKILRELRQLKAR